MLRKSISCQICLYSAEEFQCKRSFFCLNEEVMNPAPGNLDNIVLDIDVHKAFDMIKASMI